MENDWKTLTHRVDSRQNGGRTIGMQTNDMRTIWHADNWHGGQLACGKLAWRTIGIEFVIVSYLITLMF